MTHPPEPIPDLTVFARLETRCTRCDHCQIVWTPDGTGGTQT